LKGCRDFRTAVNAALRLLRVRQRSQKEIISRLRQKGYEQSVVNKVVAYLRDTGYLNDREFARLWIDSCKNKSFGFRRIIQELKQKGISQDIIDVALRESAKDYNEAEVAQALLEKRLSRMGHLKRDVLQRRLYSFLIRRGFHPEVVTEIVSKIK